jgi:hypothetical protein
VGNATRYENEAASGLAVAPVVHEEFHRSLDDEPGFVVAAVGMRAGPLLGAASWSR